MSPRLRKVVTLVVVSLSVVTQIVASESSVERLVVNRSDQIPEIDGSGSDSVWESAPVVTIHDAVADIPLKLQFVHDGEYIFVKACFPDRNENRKHRTLVWDDKLKYYKLGREREDCFVLKWNLSFGNKGLSLHEMKPYKADIWFWKANRTDAMGFADDKYHIYSMTPQPKSTVINLENGEKFYLIRKADEGVSAYKAQARDRFEGDYKPYVEHRMPSGSRADVRSKGVWRDGEWTIEFARKLRTGNRDDVQLRYNVPILLGVSRYEIAGHIPEDSEQPLYGCGDVGKLINLTITQ